MQKPVLQEWHKASAVRPGRPPSTGVREPGENPEQTRCCISPKGACIKSHCSGLELTGKTARPMGISQKTCLQHRLTAYREDSCGSRSKIHQTKSVYALKSIPKRHDGQSVMTPPLTVCASGRGVWHDPLHPACQIVFSQPSEACMGFTD